MDRLPTRPVRRSATSASTPPIEVSTRRASVASSSPASVGSMPRPTRLTSCGPVDVCSAANCWLIADGV